MEVVLLPAERKWKGNWKVHYIVGVEWNLEEVNENDRIEREHAGRREGSKGESKKLKGRKGNGIVQ